MYALLAIAIALAVLVVLLQMQVKLGRSMVAAAAALAILLAVTPAQMWTRLTQEWAANPLGQRTPYMFVMLTALLTMVNVLAEVMKQTGVSARLAPAMHGLFRSRRVALAAIPTMMGMLPTPGGIMLSAPMVRDLGDHVGVDRTRQACINFHFRHQWEPVWPLFPAVPLVQGILGISAFDLISHNLAITAAGLIGGTIFLLAGTMPPKNDAHKSNRHIGHHMRDFAHAFWPIVLVAVLYAGLNVPPAVGLLLAVVVLLIVHKVRLSKWLAIFKAGVEIDFVLLIFGALLFKLNLEAGGAVGDVVEFLARMHVSKYLLIFGLPMLVAYVTGVTMGTVAISFPFLVPFIGTGADANLGLQTLAFSGVIVGLLLTPVHLCMALSASYFETSLVRILLRMIGPSLCVAAAGVLMAVFFG